MWAPIPATSASPTGKKPRMCHRCPDADAENQGARDLHVASRRAEEGMRRP
jgi:hypothetical protein